MSHLTSENLKQLKEKLLFEKERILRELTDIAKPSVKESGQWRARYEDLGTDWDDNAQEVTQYATNISLEGTLETQLRDIDQALTRIEKGSYGICEIGGETISFERLKAYPETTRCREHAQ